jgi:aspartate racemase
MKTKTVGILGGLGPEATIEFYRAVFRYSVARGAQKDQDHLETIISMIPATPNRDQAIKEGKNDPVKELVCSAKRLETAGADFIVIPCNAAHFFLEDLRRAVGIPVINMIEIVVESIKRAGIEKAGLLATDGTLSGKLYDLELEKQKIHLVKLTDPEQEASVNKAVFGSSGIKAGVTEGEPKALIEHAANLLISRGAEAIIVGCTDISLVIESEKYPVPMIDSLMELAKYTVEYAYGK